MRKLVLVVVCVISVVICFSQTAPDHLKYYGYVLVDCLYDDPTDAEVKTNYLDEVQGHSNIAHLCAFFPEDDINARVTEMYSLCVRPVLQVQSIFYDLVPSAQTNSGAQAVLLDDWQARWDQFATTNANVLDAEHINCIYYLDEPAWNGADLGLTQPVVTYLKEQHPNIPILHIEAGDGISELEIPAGIDYVGFDRYGTLDAENDPIFQEAHAYMKSLMTEDQRIFLVPDAQWLPLYGEFGVTEEMMGDVLQNYYDLAVADSLVVGMINYLWPSGFDVEGHVGMRHLPSNVRDLSAQLGEWIVPNGEACIINVDELNEDSFAFNAWREGGQLHIQSEKAGVVKVYNLVGSKIISQVLFKGETTIDLPSTSGLLMIEMSAGNARKVVKVQ